MIGEDNRKNLESTARIIKRANISKDFALVFAVCNSLEEQENYVEELRQTCSKQDIVLTEVKLLKIPPVKRLFPVIKEHLEKKFGDTLPAKLGIQVTGLELSILLDEDEQVPVVLQILNMNRESFYKDLPFPFVFWLPEYACIKVANAAPDFWSFRVGTPTFCSDDITGSSLPEHMENGRDITVWQDKLAQIPVLERLLNTRQSTPVRVNLLIKSGDAYSYIGKTENARQRFEQAIEENKKASGDPQLAAEAYNKLGIIYSDMGEGKENLEKAVSFLQKYLEIVERAGRTDKETVGYNHLGLVYDRQKKYRQALRSYKEALEISRTYGHRKAEGDVLGNMGLLYRKQRKYEDALKMHQQALTISRELDDIQSEALDLSNMGLIYYEQNEHKHAVDYFEQALFRNLKTGNKLEEMNQLILLGDAWKALGDSSTALEKYLSAKAIAEEINADIFTVFDRLAALFGPGAFDDTLQEIKLLKETIEKSRQLRKTDRELYYLEKLCSVYRKQNQVTEKNNCLMQMEGILRNKIQQPGNEDELRGYYEELVKIYKELGNKGELKNCRHKLEELNDRQLIAWFDPGTVDMLDIGNNPLLQVGKTYNLNFQIVRTPPKHPLLYQGKIPPLKKVQKKSHIIEVSPIEGRRISEEEARHFVPDKKSDEMLHEKNTAYSHEQDYHIPSEHQEKIDSIRYPSPTPYMSEQPATSASFRFTSPGIGFDRKVLDVVLYGNNISEIGSVVITPKSTGDHRISVRVWVRAFGYEHDIQFPLQAAQQQKARKSNINDLTTLKPTKSKTVYKNKKGFWEADYGDGIIMVYIPPGEFTMGSNDYDNEKPPHTVFLDGYWMGKYEVTFDQYDKYCGETKKGKPSDQGWGRGKRPVIYVSWHDASAYCKWLSEKTGLKFKLPSEAQWEKAARGTDSRMYPWGNREPDETLANFDKKIGKTSPVGSYPNGASPYGLLDTAGNVWEWCNDWYESDYYKESPYKNPTGPDSDSKRVQRSGSWNYDAGYLRCAFRGHGTPSRSFDFVGFRLCQDNK